MTTTTRTILFALALTLGACGPHFGIDTPDDFVSLDEGTQQQRGYAMRATTADGVVIAVREIDDPRRGTRDFWVEAIRNRLRRAGGYALLEEEDIRAASGDTGHQMRFGRDESGRPYAYWITVFVREGRVTVVEAGGRREVFDEEVEDVRRAIASIRIQ
ncbi:serine/threonine protein kinase [Sandaracinus amylolyticus]|uniref:serine/threonine protein kinase n=1 Tax=Sandaracinus amylolyticus TaxID=927083 RepID=UPI001F4538F1|nr:serine/threonine protein kinase [Sandaracinus amylolyticus]UJR81302.1 Serine/threonine protein kinase [Sandaracinus amylolyticus]